MVAAPQSNQKKWRYGCILDAGSSGTRIYIYRWHDPDYERQKGFEKDLDRLPEIKTKKKWIKKIHPGISSFADKLDDVGKEHLKPLFDHALGVIPPDAVDSTPIFLLATAGVRLLPELKRKALLKEVCDYASHSTKFFLPDCALHIQAIPGETEGLYGWIATNYLLGSFDRSAEHHHGKGHHTYGFLDMGGASAQIAFAPNYTETSRHVDDLKFLRLRKLSGKVLEYKVFVKTWLGFGANQARTRYVTNLVEASGGPGVAELPDPCLHKGVKTSLNGELVDEKSKSSPHLLGTGKFEECQLQVHSLLSTNTTCETDACLLENDRFPKIDFDVNHFLGVSEYWHTTHEIFEENHSVKAYDLATYSKRVRDFCSKDWSSVEASVSKSAFGKKVDSDAALKVCFKASWIMNILHSGIGIPRLGLETTAGGSNTTEKLIDGVKSKGFLEPFQAVDKIEDTEVSWTLGKMVMYASSMVPPAKGHPGPNLPVGFGTNSAATEQGKTPIDFEYASGTSKVKLSDEPKKATPTAGPVPSPTHKPSSSAAEDDSSRVSSLLGNSSTSRRIPGLLLIFFIFGLAMYLLLGRDRRSRLYRRVLSLLPCFCDARGKRKVIGSSGGVAYERVYDDGDLEASAGGLLSPNAFELGDFDDDDVSDAGSRPGSSRRMKSFSHLSVGPGHSVSRSRDVSPLRGATAGRRVKSPMPRTGPMG